MPKKGTRIPGVSIGALFMVAIVFLMVFVGGMYIYENYIKGKEFPSPGAVMPPATQPQPQRQPGKLTGQIVDYWTSDALGGTSAKVDIIDPADFSRAREAVTVSTETKVWVTGGGVFYYPGERYFLHLYSNEGSGYYDELVDITVPSNYMLISNEYRYSVGMHRLVQRAHKDSIIVRLLDPTGATLSNGDADSAGSTGTYTASAKTFDLKVSISLSQYKVSYARPMIFVKPTTYERVTLKGVIWVAFNNTAVSSTKLADAGWRAVSTTAFTGWVAFYKELPEIASTDSMLGSLTINIPIDTSSIASGQKVAVYVWISDLQDPAEAASFIGKSSLTAYGAYTGYGVQPLGFRPVVSGNAPANPQLSAVITTS
ncbi:MAG: hypothetical protein QXW42_04205 [Thermofilum sp.]